MYKLKQLYIVILRLHQHNRRGFVDTICKATQFHAHIKHTTILVRYYNRKSEAFFLQKLSTYIFINLHNSISIFANKLEISI